MTYRYCRVCDAPMDAPSLENVGDGAYHCPVCDADHTEYMDSTEILAHNLLLLSKQVRAIQRFVEVLHPPHKVDVDG